MIAHLSQRERTLVGGGVLAVVMIFGWQLLVEPVLERQRAAAELVPAREQLVERRRDLVGRKAAITAELEAANRQIEQLSAKFLTAATPAVAASELQKIAKEMAAQAATEVRSERILPPVERGELVEIPIEIAVTGEIRQLVDLLARLEGAGKLLTVQDLKVRVVNVSQPKDLLATLTVSGYFLSRTKT